MNISESDNLAEVNKENQLINKKLELIKFIPGISILAIIFLILPFPYFIPLIVL